jgi:ABC-type multidrug transport system ATPase subunit
VLRDVDLSLGPGERVWLGQRVRLALAMLGEPLLLLMDEPQTSLDDEALEVLAGLLGEHCERGGAVLICAPARDHLKGLPIDVSYVLRDGGLETQ